MRALARFHHGALGRRRIAASSRRRIAAFGAAFGTAAMSPPPSRRSRRLSPQPSFVAAPPAAAPPAAAPPAIAQPAAAPPAAAPHRPSRRTVRSYYQGASNGDCDVPAREHARKQLSRGGLRRRLSLRHLHHLAVRDDRRRLVHDAQRRHAEPRVLRAPCAPRPPRRDTRARAYAERVPRHARRDSQAPAPRATRTVRPPPRLAREREHECGLRAHAAASC
eukprot:7390139-Prymnesium_polylepis.2